MKLLHFKCLNIKLNEIDTHDVVLLLLTQKSYLILTLCTIINLIMKVHKNSFTRLSLKKDVCYRQRFKTH